MYSPQNWLVPKRQAYGRRMQAATRHNERGRARHARAQKGEGNGRRGRDAQYSQRAVTHSAVACEVRTSLRRTAMLRRRREPTPTVSLRRPASGRASWRRSSSRPKTERRRRARKTPTATGRQDLRPRAGCPARTQARGPGPARPSGAARCDDRGLACAGSRPGRNASPVAPSCRLRLDWKPGPAPSRPGVATDAAAGRGARVGRRGSGRSCAGRSGAGPSPFRASAHCHCEWHSLIYHRPKCTGAA